MRRHLSQHHRIDMSEKASESATQDIHHYHHTHGRASHKLNENLSPTQFTPAEEQRAKTARWRTTKR